MPRVRAPELPQNYPWLNVDRPLSLKQLRGQVVLLDFWTYCCINCLHVLPDLKFLEHKYKNNLTVIGIHSAKFDNEKEFESIRQAILRYDIEHPVLVDSGFRVWQEYAVRAWPTLIAIDPEGYVAGYVAGEGNRDRLVELVDRILSEHRAKGSTDDRSMHFTLEKQKQPLTSPLAFPGKVLADEMDDRLFVVDSGHHRVIVATPDGRVSDTIGTGTAGWRDGNFAPAQFNAPQGMAFDRDRQLLYLADTDNHAIRRIDLKRRKVETLAGTGAPNRDRRSSVSPNCPIALNSPWDLTLVGDRLFVAMAGSHQIWSMQLETGAIFPFAGTGAEAGTDGTLAEANFAQPSGITSNDRQLWIADSEISSIRQIDLDRPATVKTCCGSGDLYGFGDRDGIGSEVRLQHCLGVEYAAGYLWIADTYNHQIKRVDLESNWCETVAGNGFSGFQNGSGAIARFFEPSGLSVANGALYVADTNNHAIRRIDLETFYVQSIEFSSLHAPKVCVPV